MQILEGKHCKYTQPICQKYPTTQQTKYTTSTIVSTQPGITEYTPLTYWLPNIPFQKYKTILVEVP